MPDLDKFVEVYRGHDPVEAQMLEDVLRKEGFEARLVGTRNAALMGVGQHIVSMRIEVPASMGEEARALVESVLNDTVDVPWGEDDYPGAPEDDIETAGQGRAVLDRPSEASSDAYRPPGGWRRTRTRRTMSAPPRRRRTASLRWAWSR